MKKLIIFAFLFSFIFAKDDDIDMKKISQSFGHIIGENIKETEISFDIEELLIGIKDSLNDKISPLTENECLKQIANIQEEMFKKQSIENLEKANLFLQENAKNKNISTLLDGKVQYEILQIGKEISVKETDTPLVRLTGKYLDNSSFQEETEEILSLDETIKGLKAAIVGMKEGEKRKIYIHPDLAFEEDPKMLVVFDIEIIKADNPKLFTSEDDKIIQRIR